MAKGKKMAILYKMRQISAFLALVSVFPVGLLVYMHFTVPKFRAGDCIMFDYGPKKVYSVTEKRGFRYILNGGAIVSIEFTDRNAEKVKCVR